MKDLLFEQTHRNGTTIHRIVYIEYFSGLPHMVITDSKEKGEEKFDGYCDDWDYEKDAGNGCFIFYHAGSGGKITEIQAPHVAFKKSNHCYWMHPEAKFKGKPINTKRIDNPLSVRSKYSGRSINPLKIAEEVTSMIHCKLCGGYIGDSICSSHMNEVYNEGSGEYDLLYTDGTKVEE